MKYSFGEFCACSEQENLTDESGSQVKIEHQQFRLLLFFLQHPNSLISREDIVEQVWKGRITSDEAVRVALKKLRDTLSDSPKNPTYIKTIPKQGYKWIAKVEIRKDKQTTLRQINKKTTALAVLILSAALYWFISPSNDLLDIQDSTLDLVSITKLTSMSGSEVFADYHRASNKLAFLHRATKDDSQQLYLKYLNQNQTLKLSWDEANYSNANWSPDGKKLAFNRNTSSGKILHVAAFNDEGTLEQLLTFDMPELRNKFVSDWMQTGKSLLLDTQLSASSTHSVYEFELETKKITQFSFPNTSGRGDYLAKQSDDGNFLAILRETEPGKATLVIVGSNNKDAIAQVSLEFVPSFLSWSPDSSEISLTNFYGQHLRYGVASKTMSYTPKLPANTLDVFSHCGERCLVMRQHNGDFLDIQETPMKALEINSLDDSVIQLGRIFKYDGAQDFPVYLPNTKDIIFASLENGSLSLIRVTNGKQIAILKAGNKLITSLSVSDNGIRLAGSLNGRLFSCSLVDNCSVDYFTDSLEQALNPSFANDNQHVYFTTYIDKKPVIFRHHIVDDSRQPFLENLLAFKEINSGEKGVGINESMEAFLYINANDTWKQSRFITSLQSANVNRWLVSNNTLYHTKAHIRDSQLCQISLFGENINETCQSVGSNRFRLHFDVAEDEQSILLVESLSAESDIIKYRW